MNNKGQTLMLAIITLIIIFLIGMVIVNILKPEITTARDVNNLDCSNSSITNSNKALCLVVDATIPYFIITIISVAGGLITARLLL